MPVEDILKQVRKCTVPELMDSTDISDEMMKSILQALHLILGQFSAASQATALALAFGALAAETEGGAVSVKPEEPDGVFITFVPSFDDKVAILREVAVKVFDSYLEDLKRDEEESRLHAMPTSGTKM